MIDLFPPELALHICLALIAISAITSFISAAAGIGGGIVLLAIMAVLMPAPVIIPLHGAVQIGSNAGRTLILLRHVERSILLPFVAGSVIGAGLGGLTAVQLPPSVLKIGLGLFILWSVWGVTLKAAGRFAVIGTGVVSSFLTMFFGASGTFVSAMVKTLKLGRLEHVATHSACVMAQHIVKVAVFGLLGFAYGPYLGLIGAMIVSGFAGTLVGKKVLLKTNDAIFHKVLAVILSLLAARLLVEGILTFR